MRGIAVIYPNYLDSTNLLLLAFAAVDLDVDPSTAQRHRSECSITEGVVVVEMGL